MPADEDLDSVHRLTKRDLQLLLLCTTSVAVYAAWLQAKDAWFPANPDRRDKDKDNPDRRSSTFIVFNLISYNFPGK